MFRASYRVLLSAVSLATAITSVAACSSNGSTSTSSAPASGGQSASTAACVKTADAAVATAAAIPVMPPPPRVSAAALRGKLVVAIPQSTAVPDDAAWGNEMKTAAAAADARITVIDGAGTTTGASRAIEQAISLKPAVVVTYGVITANIGGALSALSGAGIPLVPYAPGVPDKSKYLVDQDWSASGKLMADYALAQTDCKLDAVLFTAKAFTGVTASTNAVATEVSKLCPGCKLEPVDVDVSTMATSLQPAVAAAIQRDPDLNFIIPGFDGMAPLIVPAVQQANAKISLVSQHGTSQNIGYVKSNTVQTGDVESVSVKWQAWLCMDQSLRAAAGMAPGPNYSKTPLFLITSKNAGAAANFLDSNSFVAKYTSLWDV
jgi:ribose transport system substrate-binding protein